MQLGEKDEKANDFTGDYGVGIISGRLFCWKDLGSVKGDVHKIIRILEWIEVI
jgi:hypothetical protein